MSNPYLPPTAPVGGADSPVVLTVRRLVRWYQALVVTATLLGIILFVGVLGIFASPDMASVQALEGAGAVLPGEAAIVLFGLLQILWIASAIGLCFFTRWGRPLFIGTYVLSTVGSLTSGVQVWLPWEVTVVTAASLMDGAVMVLSFLPPISGYFARERTKV